MRFFDKALENQMSEIREEENFKELEDNFIKSAEENSAMAASDNLVKVRYTEGYWIVNASEESPRDHCATQLNQ